MITKNIYDIQLVAAPSILGLKPSGVEYLPESLLSHGLREKLQSINPVVTVPTLNSMYNRERDKETHCLNPGAIREFSESLCDTIKNILDKNQFPFVLGGDCSILIGIMPALKQKGNYGLIFFDAHADFYEPERSITGEVADMDLGIVTGRGPALLTNIKSLNPYIKDEQVIHVGQRDREETLHYGSQDIKETRIRCFDLNTIKKNGDTNTINAIIQYMGAINPDGFWIHFDTDVLSDLVNPAVDYRLPGGLSLEQAGFFLKTILATRAVAGISITIFNPVLDKNGAIAEQITGIIGEAFSFPVDSSMPGIQ